MEAHDQHHLNSATTMGNVLIYSLCQIWITELHLWSFIGSTLPDLNYLICSMAYPNSASLSAAISQDPMMGSSQIGFQNDECRFSDFTAWHYEGNVIFFYQKCLSSCMENIVVGQSAPIF